MATEQRESYAGWTVLELFGHRRLAGYVSEVQVAGAGFVRIQIPGDNGEWAAEQSYGPAAIYSITPCTEEVARAMVKRGAASGEITQFSLPEPRVRWACPKCEYSMAVPEDEEARCSRCRTVYVVERTSEGVLFKPAMAEDAGDDDDGHDDSESAPF